MIANSFADIRFGAASGEREGSDYPELVTHGFFDIHGALNRLKNESVAIVLGYKGSGKSLLGERLRLEAEASNNSVVRVLKLKEFPFQAFDQIFPGSIEADARLPGAWAWILLLVTLDILRESSLTATPGGLKLLETLKTLEETGLLPTNDLQRLVVRSARHDWKIKISEYFEIGQSAGSENDAGELNFLALLHGLRELVYRFRVDRRIYVIVDGLDEFLTSNELQYKSLAALVSEIVDLNRLFKQKGKGVKFIVLCRTDLFERLPHPNKNKLKQDYGLPLDWYHDVDQPGESALVTLANLRAGLGLGRPIDLFKEVFPENMRRHGSTLRFLLQHTRHTPRDFLQLLIHIQRYARGFRLTENQVLDGLGHYSRSYFLPEIRDELVGYLPPVFFDSFLGAVGQIRERRFNYRQLSDAALTKGLDQTNLTQTLSALFECGAIGNTWESPQSGATRFEFKYRNRSGHFDPSKSILLHRGLWKALNLV